MMIKIVLFLFLMSPIFAQDPTTNVSELPEVKPKSRTFFTFRHQKEDKYYIGWMNPRAFVSRAYIKHNFNFREAILARNPASEPNWNFPAITAIVQGRIATEFFVFRNHQFAIGVGAAFEAPLVLKKRLILTQDRLNIANIYSLIGNAAAFIDVYLPYELRLRITPFYHESVHIADGYVGNPADFSFISYDFFALELYSKIKTLTLYTGIEVTYHHARQTERLLRTRLQFGADYRYPLWKDTINLIVGINIAALFDERNTRFPETSGWHPALNMAIGVEFDPLIVSLKYSHQRGYESVTYQTMQNSLGIEFTVTF